jgi:hypothetical protein
MATGTWASAEGRRRGRTAKGGADGARGGRRQRLWKRRPAALMATAAAGDDACERALQRRAWPRRRRVREGGARRRGRMRRNQRRWVAGLIEAAPALGRQWRCRTMCGWEAGVRWEVGWMDKVGGRIDLFH